MYIKTSELKVLLMKLTKLTQLISSEFLPWEHNRSDKTTILNETGPAGSNTVHVNQLNSEKKARALCS